MTADSNRPLVSVVIPMLNEQGFIDVCLDSFSQQDYPLECLDVIVVDGGSTDGSREYVDQRSERDTWIRVVENPKQKAASAFNCGMNAARGKYFCLFSSHGVADPNYISLSVDVLEETGAAGVGGRVRHDGIDASSEAIGMAMVSRFGMASPRLVSTTRKDVDSISHPAYITEAARSIGQFNEQLERNSDYEFNHRMLQAGFRLLFEPEIESTYRPRGSLTALGRQFWWYGRWKEQVVHDHPDSLKPRQLAAPGAVLGLIVAPVLMRWPIGRRLVAMAAMSYLALASAAVVTAKPSEHEASPTVMLMAFPVMHTSWGAGFLASVARRALRSLGLVQPS